jgi:hypothetical protein
MSGGIFLIREDGGLVEMSERPYDSEDLLQRLLADHPSVLAGTQLGSGEPRRWLLVRREVGVPSEEAGGGRWSLDHLFLDQEGIPTLVEVKRSTDTRIRREVVGQMLDYAANAVVYWPVEQLRAAFATRCQTSGTPPEEEMAAHLGPNVDPDQIWDQVDTNLKAGRVRLVFVADEIPAELQRIIEFLDGQMNQAEVLGVEIRQYVGPGMRTLVPRGVGKTAQAGQRKRHAAEQREWDEESFFAELSRRGDDRAVQVARRIMDWTRERNLRIWWGKGAQNGSYIPTFDVDGTGYWLGAVRTNARFEFGFKWLSLRPPFDDETRRRDLLDRLNRIPGIDLPADSINLRPTIPLSDISAEESTEMLLDVWDDLLAQVTGMAESER